MSETYLEKLKRIREEMIMEDREIIPINKKIYYSTRRLLEYVYERMCEQAKDPEVKCAKEEFKIYGNDIKYHLIHALTALNPEEPEEKIRKKAKSITSQQSILIVYINPEQYKELFEMNNDKENNCISFYNNGYYMVFICEETLKSLAEQEGIYVSFLGLEVSFITELPPYTFETKLKLMQDEKNM